MPTGPKVRRATVPPATSRSIPRSPQRRLTGALRRLVLVAWAVAALFWSSHTGMQPLQAETQSTSVGGPITQNTTWTKAGSPYITASSVTVREDVTLLIEPGVVVRFGSGHALNVAGTLVARGTLQDPIRFTADSDSPQPGTWNGIGFLETSADATFDGSGNYTGGSIVQHAIVEYAGGGERGGINTNQASPWIDQNVVRYNAGPGGIRVRFGAPRVTNNQVHDNNNLNFLRAGAINVADSTALIQANRVYNTLGSEGHGIAIWNLITPVTIEDNVVFNNTGMGIGSETTGAIIRRNHVYRNNEGIIGHGQITRNIVAYNSGIGVKGDGTISHNQIAHNGRVAIEGYYPGGGATAITYNSIVYNRGPGTGSDPAGIDWRCGGQVTYNTIVGQRLSNTSASRAGGLRVAFHHPACRINNNNLYGNEGRQLAWSSAFVANTLLNARNNYWGTTDENLINQAIYDFYDDSSLGEVDYGDYLASHELDAPPTPPTGLSVDVQFDSFILTWNANPEADIAGYKVYYDTDGRYPWDGKGAEQGDAGIDVGKVTTFALRGLPAGRNTYFMVTAYDASGDESWYSLEQMRRLPAPIVLHAEAGSRNVLLEWNPTNDPTFSSYRLQRAISGTTAFQAVAQNLVDTTYFDRDASLIPGSSYCYKVDALAAGGARITTSNHACITFGRMELWIPDTVGRPNEVVRVPINIGNADGLRIGSSDIWLDFDSSVLEVVSVDRAPLTVNYAWAHAVQPVSGNTHRVRIAYIHPAQQGTPPQLHGNGTLFYVNFRIKGEDGNISPLDLQDFISGIGGSSIQNEAALTLPLTLVDATLFVEQDADAAFILGDLNGDGVVSAVDAALALRFAAGQATPTPQQVHAGDINGDGVIQAADASMILYYAANQAWPPLPGAVASAGAHDGEATVILDSVTGRAGAVVQTTLRATGLNQFAGGDFVLVYDPETIVAITNVALDGIAAGFDELEFHNDGIGRFFFSLAGKQEISGDGVLVRLSVQLNSGLALGTKVPLLLADAKLNDLNGRDFVKAFADRSLARQGAEITVGNLQASPSSFSYNARSGEGNPPAQTLKVDVGNDATAWSITTAQPWIQIGASSGQGTQDVTIAIVTTGLAVGTHQGTLTVQAGNETSQHMVTLVLQAGTSNPDPNPEEYRIFIPEVQR